MRSARAKSSSDRTSSNMKVDRQGATLVLAGEDIVSMTVKRFPLQQNGAQRSMGLGTDAAIGGRTAGGTGMRNLKKVWRNSAVVNTYVFDTTDPSPIV